MNLEPDVILLEEEDRAVDVDHSRRRPHRSRERSRSYYESACVCQCCSRVVFMNAASP